MLIKVQLDTGSSDLWLDPSNVTFTSSLTNTDIFTRIGYGYAEHIIHGACVEFFSFQGSDSCRRPALLAKSAQCSFITLSIPKGSLTALHLEIGQWESRPFKLVSAFRRAVFL